MTKKYSAKVLVIVFASASHALHATAIHAEPAVFFNPDLDAGRTRFTTVINSTVASPNTVELFTLNLSSATTLSGNLYAVTGSSGTTTYVRLSANGTALNQGNFGAGGGGIYSTSVSIQNSGLAAWNEAVDEGFVVEFFSDAGATTPVSMNALGMEVNDWGTCCFASTDNNGNMTAATSVYAVFNPNGNPSGSDPNINLIGSITNSADRGSFAGTLANGTSTNYNNHFVAAINDTNMFNSIAIVPNGSGEAFGYGGIIYFSQVAIGSVPPGSSDVVIGSKTDIVDPGSLQADLGDTLNYAFDGGELLLDANSSDDFEFKAGGGSLNTQGSNFVFAGDFTGVGQLIKTGAGTLVLTGTNTHAGGTVVSAGTLSTAGGGTLADDGDIDIAAGAQFIAGTADTVGDVTNAGLLQVDAALQVASLDNTGITTVNSALTSTGGIAVRAGSTMNMNADVEAGAAFLNDGAVTVAGDRTLTTVGLTGAGAIVLSDGADLSLVQSGNSAFAGSITGAGGFRKAGAGTLVLTGANTHAGGTVVSAGTLSTAGGGTLADDGDIDIAAGAQFIAGTADTVGDVTNAGLLQVDAALQVASLDNSGTTTVNSTLTSTGDVTIRTGSALNMNGDVTALGLFDLNGDTLVAGDNRLDVATLAGTGTLWLSPASTLDLAIGEDSAFNGSITGAEGNFVKRGAGTLTLTQANVSNTATVAEGTLQLLSSYSTNQFSVNAGATLFGTGSINGNLHVDGRLLPGNGPGTMVVNGDVVFGSGSIFSAEIDGRDYDSAGGPGMYDRLVVMGVDSVVYAGGTIAPMLRGLDGANNDFTPIVGDVFRVIEVAENPNGISGTFDDLMALPDGIAPGTRFSVVYGENYIDLAIIPHDFGSFASAFGYENMTRAGAAFESIFTPQVAASDFLNGLNGLSTDGLAMALLQASGEIHAFSLAGVKQAGQSFTGAALGRLNSSPDGRRLWSDLSGYRADYDDDAVASMYKADHHHIWLGLDMVQTETMRAGAAIGYTGGSIDAAYSGSADYEGVNAAVYLHQKFGQFKLSATAGLGLADITTERSTALSTGTTENTSKSRANLAFAEARLSYDHGIGQGLMGTAWSGLRLDSVRAKSFVEDGSALTALTVDRQNDSWATISAGYDLSGAFDLGDADGKWRVGIGVMQTDDDGRVSSRDLSMHGTGWQVSSPKAEALQGFASAGFQVALNRDSFLDVSVRTAGAKNWESYGASINFSTRW